MTLIKDLITVLLHRSKMVIRFGLYLYYILFHTSALPLPIVVSLVLALVGLDNTFSESLFFCIHAALMTAKVMDFL